MEPKLRFKEFSGDWKKFKLKDLTIQSGKKNKNNEQYPCFSINNKIGFIKQEDQFENNRYTTLDKTLYLIVEPHEFAYNPARINIGSIGYQNIGEPVIVSSLYEIFKTTKNCVDDFLFHFFSTNYFNLMVSKYSEGSVRMYLFYENFKKIPLFIPLLPEQTKIADFLSTVDDKIQNQQDKITHLENIKKGFMQKIFSRKIRFKDDQGNEFPEWKEKKIKDLFTVRAGGDIDSSMYTKVKTKENIYPVYANSLEQDGLYGYSSLYKIDGECITVTARGNIGFAIPRNEKFYPIVRLLVLKPKTNSNVKFFSEIINSTTILIESTGVPQLTAPQIEKVKVKNPCLEEQQKIADFLSSFDEKIDVEKNTLDHLKELKKGLLQQMFV